MAAIGGVHRHFFELFSTGFAEFECTKGYYFKGLAK